MAFPELFTGHASMLDTSIRSSVTHFDRRRVLSGIAALLVLVMPSAPRSAPVDGETDEDAPVAGLQRLLARIREQHPGASILKVGMRTRDLEGRQMIYDVKVLSHDGRVFRLVFDARTLEQPEPLRSGQLPADRRRRVRRRRGNW